MWKLHTNIIPQHHLIAWHEMEKRKFQRKHKHEIVFLFIFPEPKPESDRCQPSVLV